MEVFETVNSTISEIKTVSIDGMRTLTPTIRKLKKFVISSAVKSIETSLEPKSQPGTPPLELLDIHKMNSMERLFSRLRRA